MNFADGEIHLHHWYSPGLRLRGSQLSRAAQAKYAELVDVEYSQHASGQPYLTNSPYGLSISHSRDRALLVLRRGGMVGCDIQYHANRSTEAIAKRFFHPDEVQELADGWGKDHFYRLWSLKEAHGKLTQSRWQTALGTPLGWVTECQKANLDDDSDEAFVIQGTLGYWVAQPFDCYHLALAVDSAQNHWRLRHIYH